MGASPWRLRRPPRFSENEIFMQSPGRRYLAKQGKQLHRETTSVKVSLSKVLFHAVGLKKKKVVHRQKARIHIRIRSMDLHFMQSTKYKFCVSLGFIPAGVTGCHVTRWERVFFYFLLVQQSRKRVAEPHPCFIGNRHCSRALDWAVGAACQAEAGFRVNQTVISYFYIIITCCYSNNISVIQVTYNLTVITSIITSLFRIVTPVITS